MEKSCCPVCGYKDHKVVGYPRKNRISEKFIDKDFQVVCCRQCRLYFVFPEIRFTDDQWSQLYNSEYFGVQSEWLIRKREKELNERFNKVEEFVGRGKELNLLDIGTGEGKTLIAGKKRNWNVTGIDIVDNRIENAKSESIKFVKGKFLETDLPHDHYDFIYLDSVLEHVLNPLDYLNKIKQLLRTGGVAYIGVPNEDSLFNDVRKTAFKLSGKNGYTEKIKPFDSPYHVIGFNSHSFETIIHKAGLNILYLRNFGRKMEFLGSPVNSRSFWIALLFLFPIEIIGNLIKRDVYFEAYVLKK